MTTLRKALPWILSLLVLALAFVSFRQQQRNAPSVHAQAPQANCTAVFTFSAGVPQASQANHSSITGTPCATLGATLEVTGTFAATVQFETSPDNSTWTAVPNTACSSSVLTDCVLKGANPIGTLATHGLVQVLTYAPFWRINPTAVSGAGTATVKVYGYILTASGSSIGGGSKGSTGATGPAGPSGGSGPSGPSGPAGGSGPSGPVGPSGPAGGPSGPSGPAGPSGPSGAGGGGGVTTSGWTAANGALINDSYSDSLSVGILESANWRIAIQTLPSAPYTIIAKVHCLPVDATISSQLCGLYLYDGSKAEGIDLLYQTGVINSLGVRTVGSLTSSASTVVSSGPTVGLVGSQATFKIVDDTTHRTFSYYAQGAYHQFFQENSGTFLTPTSAGPGGISQVSTSAMLTAILTQWVVTTP